MGITASRRGRVGVGRTSRAVRKPRNRRRAWTRMKVQDLSESGSRAEPRMAGDERSRGFASGTVSGANTRRYHALLLIAQQPGTNRYVLVNHVEEWLIVDGEHVSLSTNLYPDTVHPQGYAHCFRSNRVPGQNGSMRTSTRRFSVKSYAFAVMTLFLFGGN